MYWMPLEIRRRDDGELADVLELDEILVRQIVGDVGVAALEQRAPVAGGRHHAPDDALDLRQRPAHPLVVALEDDLGAGVPAHHPIGAAAGGVLLGVFEAPRVFLGGVLLDQLGVDRSHGTITARSGIVSRSLRRKSTRTVWSSTTTNCSGLVSEPAPIWKVGKAADGDGAVERPFHVLGGDRRAVLEDRVLLQLEGGRHVADVHVVGELHLELVAVVIRRAVRQRLHLVADEPVVAIPRHLVARARWCRRRGCRCCWDRSRRRSAASPGATAPWPDDQTAGAAGSTPPAASGGHRFQEIATLHANLQSDRARSRFRKGRARNATALVIFHNRLTRIRNRAARGGAGGPSRAKPLHTIRRSAPNR